jgi:hypothetical protein
MKDLFAVVVFLSVMIISEGSSWPALVTGTGDGAVGELRSSVLSLDKVIRNTMKTINENPGTTLLTPQETRELKEFALYLQTRVVFYCEQLASQFPVQSMADLPCPPPNNPVGSGLTLPPPTTTGKEEIDNLEQQLTESMGAFDEMLLAEETRIASHRPNSSEKERGDTGGQGAVQGGVQSEKDAAKGDKGRAGREKTGETAGGQDKDAAGVGQVPEQGRTPSVSNNGAPGKLVIDDDIVARQLREAAEKEQDPQLKEKLWQEYWKYKGKKM